MFAGAISLDPNRQLNKTLAIALRKSLSRNPNKYTWDRKSANAYIVHCSVNALSSYSGRICNGDEIAILCGEPFAGTKDISSDHSTLVKALADDQLEAFRSARGVFCGMRYAYSQEPVLEIFSDKLGVRPIYYLQHHGTVIFATALRVLEKLPDIDLAHDEQGIIETVGLGYPLADRTRYKNIRVIREAQIIQFSKCKTSVRSYWKWDQIKVTDRDPNRALEEAYSTFRSAIEIRQKNDRDAVAFVSGGMDSRAILSVLSNLNVDLHALNCSPERSQDRVFARLFSEAVKCKFSKMPFGEEANQEFRLTLATKAKAFLDKEKVVAQRPYAIWSGDGGSVGLGSVYMDRRLVELLRQDKVRDAVKYFRATNGFCLPLGVMRNRQRNSVDSSLDNGILEELGRLNVADAAQAFFLFLMINDQRRHLHGVYENLDLHGLEYQLPFFDSRLIEIVFSLPIDYRLNHVFYTDWFELFPVVTRAVPWQTYPGHQTCPLPIRPNLDDQWAPPTQSYLRRTKKRMVSALKGVRLLGSWPDKGPISKRKFVLAVTLQLLGIRDYNYVINAADEFWRRP